MLEHEKLDVYKKSLDLIGWLNDLLKNNKKYYNISNQIDRASISIVLNIAEGNGKYSSKDKARFFDIAKGSALETAACLDILFTKEMISESSLNEGKEKVEEIVKMIMGLIKYNSNRVYEDGEEYLGD